MKLSQEERETFGEIARSAYWTDIKSLNLKILKVMENRMLSVSLDDDGEELYRARLRVDGVREFLRSLDGIMSEVRKD